jgi:hypothetical protein
MDKTHWVTRAGIEAHESTKRAVDRRTVLGMTAAGLAGSLLACPGRHLRPCKIGGYESANAVQYARIQSETAMSGSKFDGGIAALASRMHRRGVSQWQ